MFSNLQPNDTYFETNGVRLHAVQAGPQDGRLIILLHGFPETWRAWRHQITPLARAGYRILAPDQRGYSTSSKPQGLEAYQLDELAKDVVGLIESLERERAILVGHDWGGVVAWAVAALYPERVERLVVLNAPYPTVPIRAVWRDPSQFLRSLYVFFAQLPQLPEAILRNNQWQLLAESLERTSRPGTFDENDLQHYRQAWWQRGAMTAMLNWYRALLRRPQKLPALVQIKPPTLILWGKKDVALSPVNAEMSLDLCLQGCLEFHEQATHWVQHEEAEWVNLRLLDFLQSSSC